MFKPHDVIIAGIDPGTTNIGLSFTAINPVDWSITSVVAKTVNAENAESLIFAPAPETYAQSPSLLRLHYLATQLTHEFMAIRPSLIVYEAPFYNPGRPGAYGPLLESVMAIHTAAFNYNPNIPVVKYAPSLIKVSVGAKSDAGKIPIKDAVFKIPELLPYMNRGYSDHAIDAIAIAYTHITHLRKYLPMI